MILKFGRARGLETEHLFYVALCYEYANLPSFPYCKLAVCHTLRAWKLISHDQ